MADGDMGLGERILRAFSRAPDADSQLETTTSITDGVDRLRVVFPDFDRLVAGREVLDFGCGTGEQVVALATHGVHAVGVDINRKWLERARALASARNVTENAEFVETLPPARLFDVIISQDSMEHFSDPAGMLRLMAAHARRGGVLLITFSPPWYAPYGSHMHFFTRIPWVHLLFSERTVLRVRSRYKQDGALKYEDVEGGLNRMSIAKFEDLVAASGLHVDYQRYDAVKNIPILWRIPGVRELVINRVSVILSKP